MTRKKHLKKRKKLLSCHVGPEFLAEHNSLNLLSKCDRIFITKTPRLKSSLQGKNNVHAINEKSIPSIKAITESTFHSEEEPARPLMVWKDSLVARTSGSKMITRKFSLSPRNGNRKEAISKIHVGLAKARALTDIHVRDIIKRIKSGQLNASLLKSESKRTIRKQIYDEFNYSIMSSPAFKKYPKPLHERIKQAAFYRALTMTRLWLMRNHNLGTCIDELQELFRTDMKASLRFLQGKNLHGNPIKPFYNALSIDVFGRKQVMTNYFLNNHLKQVKNLLIDSNDLNLINHVKDTITSLLDNGPKTRQIINSFVEKVISSFKEKRKGKHVSVGVERVPSHLLTQFFKKLSLMTTNDAKNIISHEKNVARLDRKIRGCKNEGQRERLSERKKKALNTIKNCQERLNIIIPELKRMISSLNSNEDLKQFKTQRKLIFDDKKAEILNQMKINLTSLIKEALTEELHGLSTEETSKRLLIPIFKPSFPKIFVKKVQFEVFMDYFNTKINYAIRSELKTLFLSASGRFLEVLSLTLPSIKNDLESLVRIPTARNLMVQIQDSYNYKPDYDNLTTKLGLCRHDIIDFKINDRKEYRNKNNEYIDTSRIHELLKHDNVEVKLPAITLKAGKIIMSLPFKIKNTSSSKRPYNPQVSRNGDISVKVDMGLIHFAVISVVNENYKKDTGQKGKGKPTEIARYFIGQKQVFDLKFVDGRLVSQKSNEYRNGQLIFSKDKKPSNVMLKVRNIRNEIARVQKQLADYKKAHPTDFRKKYKYYRLRRQYKTLWSRVNNINNAIKCHVSQLLIKIANHHRADCIYFEDLKWSSVKKKAQAGKYLSFMAFHWLHAQVQDHVEQRGRIEGIKVKKVNAAYTSQRCSECGLIEYKNANGELVYLKKGLTRDEQKEKHLYRTKSRKGKLFRCQNIKKHPKKKNFQLDSDLNAARNIGPWRTPIQFANLYG